MKSPEIETSRVHHAGCADLDRPVIEGPRVESPATGRPRGAQGMPTGGDARGPVDGTLAVEAPGHAESGRSAASPGPRERRTPGIPLDPEAMLRSLVAGLLLGLTLPLVLAAMAVTALTSRGPALYTQWRVGRGGRPFRIYKIRTMIHDSERACGPRWASPDDPRVTWFGRFLRRTHLDEIPQFWNIIRGEMSLVGPRPERPEIQVEILSEIPSYILRTTVTPGLTGLAQLLQGPDVDLETVRRKLDCDRYYIEHRGWALDGKILLATPLRMIGLPSRVLVSLFRLPSLEDCRRGVSGPEGPDTIATESSDASR